MASITSSVESLTPVSHQYYQFLLSFILYALSASLIYTPSIAVLSHWFEKKLGMAVGLVVCGAGIGGIIYPIIFERGFASLGEWGEYGLTPWEGLGDLERVWLTS